jgi:hypothetical protein
MKIPGLVRQSTDLRHRAFEAERFAHQNLLAYPKFNAALNQCIGNSNV